MMKSRQVVSFVPRDVLPAAVTCDRRCHYPAPVDGTGEQWESLSRVLDAAEDALGMWPRISRGPGPWLRSSCPSTYPSASSRTRTSAAPT